MDVTCSSPLKLNPVAYVPDTHWVVAAENDFSSEGFHSVLEISCGGQHIFPYQFVLRVIHILFQILFPRKFDDVLTSLDLHSDLLASLGIHLVVNFTAQFFEDGSEVGAPSLIGTREREENVEGSDVFQFCYHVIFGPLPILWRTWNLFQNRTGIVEAICYLTVRSDVAGALYASEIGVRSKPLSFHQGHCSEHITRCFGEAVVHIQNSLFKIFLIGQFHFSFVVQTKLTVGQETRPTLVIPIFHIKIT